MVVEPGPGAKCVCSGSLSLGTSMIGAEDGTGATWCVGKVGWWVGGHHPEHGCPGAIPWAAAQASRCFDMTMPQGAQAHGPCCPPGTVHHWPMCDHRERENIRRRLGMVRDAGTQERDLVLGRCCLRPGGYRVTKGLQCTQPGCRVLGGWTWAGAGAALHPSQAWAGASQHLPPPPEI